jgi:hypothetical protein
MISEHFQHFLTEAAVARNKKYVPTCINKEYLIMLIVVHKIGDCLKRKMPFVGFFICLVVMILTVTNI